MQKKKDDSQRYAQFRMRGKTQLNTFCMAGNKWHVCHAPPLQGQNQQREFFTQYLQRIENFNETLYVIHGLYVYTIRSCDSEQSGVSELFWLSKSTLTPNLTVLKKMWKISILHFIVKPVVSILLG